MVYKGFEISKTQVKLDNGVTIEGWGIFKDGERKGLTDTADTAKRYIDCRLQTERRDCY